MKSPCSTRLDVELKEEAEKWESNLRGGRRGPASNLEVDGIGGKVCAGWEGIVMSVGKDRVWPFSILN